MNFLLPYHRVKLHYHSEIISFLVQKFVNLSLETTLSRETANMPTCLVISRQLQELDSRRVRICSKLYVLHVFKARIVEVSLLHRYVQSNEQAPCTHPLLSVSYRNLTFSYYDKKRRLKMIQCLIIL